VAVLLLLVLLLCVPALVVLVGRPVERRLALRYPRRRPVEALLVVLGALLGTGIITGSLVVGDTIDRSIRAEAYDQLGPIDQLVSVSGSAGADEIAARLVDLDHPDVDGVFAFASAPAAVTGIGAAPLGQPRAQILELDFEAAAAFGGDPEATGIEGPTPAPGTAAVTEDLARRLEVGPGDGIVVYAYGRALPLEVDRVLDRRGVAGFWVIDARRQSFNVLVGPGVLAELSAGPAAGAEPPTGHVAISNVGGVEDGATRTEAVTEAAEGALAGLGARVQTVKQDTLDEATEAAESLTQLYFTMGMFAVAAGILLLVNIFVMLADDRRGEMGMMRALGLRRLPLVGAYATEGWLYSLVGSALGALLGIGFGRVIAWRADSILQGGDEVFALDLTFAWTWPTVLQGAALGFLISLVTILATSVRVSRLNVIAAIRDLPTVHRRRPRRRLAWAGATAVVLGVLWTAAGIAGPDAYGVIMGPMLAAVGLLPILGRRLPLRPVTAVVAVAVLAWGAAFPWALGALDVNVTIPLFLVQGIAMAAAAVTLVTLFQGVIGRRLGSLTRGSLGVRLGLAYPVARRFRTAMTLGMFAVVILTLVYIAILSHMFSGQVDDITEDLTGGFGVVVTSNPTDPVPVDELAATPGVGAVAPLRYGVADFVRPSDPEPVTWFVTGFGPEFAAAPIAMQDLGPYASAEEAFAAVLADPGLVIVDEFFLVTGAGPPSSTLGVGDTVTIVDRVSGRDRELTVAALAEVDFLFAGAYLGEEAYGEVFGERAVASRFYVGADLERPGAAEETVDAIRRRFVANGADAETVRSRVESLLAQNTGFFTLMQQFVGVGLVVGIAGIGVILVRAVRERRREVGVLRALGFQPRSVAVGFLVEALFVAIEGVLIGVAVALIGSYGLVASGTNFTEGFDFAVPWPSVLVIVAIAVVTSALAALWPAVRAARIRPAAALRLAD
jgi:putative ABC transport system permease protein